MDWNNLISLNGLKERTSTHLEPIWSSRALQCVSTLISTSFFAAFPTDLLESKQLVLLALWLISFAWFGQFTKSITSGRDYFISGQVRKYLMKHYESILPRNPTNCNCFFQNSFAIECFLVNCPDVKKSLITLGPMRPFMTTPLLSIYQVCKKEVMNSFWWLLSYFSWLELFAMQYWFGQLCR